MCCERGLEVGCVCKKAITVTQEDAIEPLLIVTHLLIHPDIILHVTLLKSSGGVSTTRECPKQHKTRRPENRRLLITRTQRQNPVLVGGNPEPANHGPPIGPDPQIGIP
ncbi:hypothetical protein DPEC_G00088660 [Dallia pectoralis]|uniref:Uncharacterized protein n=1 Tax=Dallia pectoralis TaxID=75939 RepID=A0ACC2H0Y5_DALPE|nr:hypothetical protein DPEC_G00088660 [Dallia pectoralis]